MATQKGKKLEKQKSLLETGNKAIMNRVELEFGRVLANFDEMGKDFFQSKRKIKVEIQIWGSDDGKTLFLEANSSSTLIPPQSILTKLERTVDDEGKTLILDSINKDPSTLADGPEVVRYRKPKAER